MVVVKLRKLTLNHCGQWFNIHLSYSRSLLLLSWRHFPFTLQDQLCEDTV